VVALDPSTLAVRERTWFYDPSLACVQTRDGLVGFFGQSYRPLTGDGKLARLDQPWTVEAVVRESPGDALWLCGVLERTLYARRMSAGTPESVEIVGEAETSVERILATFSPEGGLTVAWKEKQRSGVKLARRGPERFARLPDVPIGDAGHWTTIQLGARQLVIAFDRKDQAVSTLTLQVRCCETCGLPPPPPAWTFRDSFQLLARRVTGLAAAVEEDRIRLALTRVTVLQSASVPLASLLPETESALESIRVEAPWVRYAALVLPSVLLLFAFSLIYLGFVLLRERRRAMAQAAGVKASPAGPYADVMQRMMAFLIDQMALTPVLMILVDVLGLATDAPEVSITDPRELAAVGIGFVINALYFFILEAWTGRTLGKYIVGIRVIDIGSDRLSLGRALTRNLLRCVDAYAIFVVVGLGAILLTRRRQRIGDLIAGTVVVQAHPDAEMETVAQKPPP
jgi:uncharacterized RDD family membrane protein YckC